VFLIARSHAFYGVLPAWFLILILLTIPVLLFSNKMRALALVRGAVEQTARETLLTPRVTGIALIVAVPALVVLLLFQYGNFGLAWAVALSVLPIIFGTDLLLTRSPRALPLATDQ
jgi:hypothetical protein